MRENREKPWEGRFQEETDEFVELFTESVSFDSALGVIDARCSIAHAKTLLDAEIITKKEYRQIEAGLRRIIQEIENEKFDWDIALEDVHMNIEQRLVQYIGQAGLKLHTGRSRNDQVTATFKVYLIEESADLVVGISVLQEVLLNLAQQHIDTIMPGFTHLQSAQPITFGHHLMAWFEMLDRDWTRLLDWIERTNVSPMGVAALAGTSYPLDRTIFQHEMGFVSITRNSLDTVSDRDYVIELLQMLSLLMVHLSRFSEEIILWNSTAFNFIELPDSLCTGSSIMPQKKNPDIAELIRGKCGRVIGSMNALLVTLKGQPLAYNRDNQEDKEPVFDALLTATQCLLGMTLLVEGMRPNKKEMLAMASRGHPTATDMADWLVRKGVAFREAHSVCGRAVALADKSKLELNELSLEQLKSLSDSFDESVYDYLTLEGSVAARSLPGGTAPRVVRSAIEEARELLEGRNELIEIASDR